MTNLKKALLAGAALVLGVGALTQVALAHGDGARGQGPQSMMGAQGRHDMGGSGHHGMGGSGHYGMGGHGFGGGSMARQVFELFDTNKDGALTQAEIDAERAATVKRFDKNGDGTLSLDEYQVFWMERMRERMVDRFQAHDDDGDGQITAKEMLGQFETMVERHDRNGDGKVMLDEMMGGGRGHHGMHDDDDDKDGKKGKK